MSHFTSKEEIVTAIAGEVTGEITLILGLCLRQRAGSAPGQCAQSLSERGGVEAGAEGELVEEGRAEGGPAGRSRTGARTHPMRSPAQMVLLSEPTDITESPKAASGGGTRSPGNRDR